MGIKYFFGWLRQTFPSHIRTINMSEDLRQVVEVDTFLIDMNGIFHYCCQKVYQYGNFKHLRDSSYNSNRKTTSSQRQKMVMRMVGSYIDKLMAFVKPKKRVVMAIDGPAPLSKQSQQRSRRYRSARDNEDGMFDSNSITPGTVFLDHLSKYIDWHIRQRVSQGLWGDIDVIFSSEKSSGEGEHKLVKFVREHGTDDESYMMQGMDADLVMLSLATQKPNFHILRENPYRYEHEYYYINLSKIRETLVNSLLCEQSLNDDSIHINDFIAMIFFTGNDFLPHLPTIEILEGGVEHLFETYRMIVKQYGSLTTNIQTFNIKAVQVFLGTLGQRQTEALIEKRSKSIEFPDMLLAKHTRLQQSGQFHLDWENYRTEYYATKMNCYTEEDIHLACMKYVEGLQWVLTYYTKGTPHAHWRWFYPYDHAPFLTDIAANMDSYYEWIHKNKKLNRPNNPYQPFLQLLSVLPPKSNTLLPHPLSGLMTNPNLLASYPDSFEVDMDGKKNEWEGVVKLPPLDYVTLEQEYEKVVRSVEERDRRRNFIGKSFLYTATNHEYVFKSYYGDIEQCLASSTIFPL
uniref:Xrn1 N-terminal domain-containing protein n=1 Tax=viral metagenome TaxID=1070528 RepID=A0A6C0KHI2_9ZZZZ